MPEAVIVDAIRTPIGRAVKGSLKTVRADDLAAIPIKALIERNPGVNFSETTDVLMGAASGIGEQGYNVGRNAAPDRGPRPPRPRLHRQPLLCLVADDDPDGVEHAVRAGEGDQYIAAGVEAVSRGRAGRRDDEPIRSITPLNLSSCPMGI